jgi:hypothetical protein
MRSDQTIKSYRKNSSEEGRARSETGVRIEEENNAELASSGWVVVVVVIVPTQSNLPLLSASPEPTLPFPLYDFQSQHPRLVVILSWAQKCHPMNLK